MVLIITNSSWAVISEMELPSGCEEVETVELLSSLEPSMGKSDNYGAKSGNCMRTVQVAVTLKQCEGEESQGHRQAEFHEIDVSRSHIFCLPRCRCWSPSYAPQSEHRFDTGGSMRKGPTSLWEGGAWLFVFLTAALTSIKSRFIFYSPPWKTVLRDL